MYFYLFRFFVHKVEDDKRLNTCGPRYYKRIHLDDAIIMVAKQPTELEKMGIRSSKYPRP